MRDRNREGVLKSKQRDAWRGLQVVKKSFNGIRIGYVVGWWKCKSRWNSDRGQTFQSFREGVIFRRESEALAYRDNIEKMREGNTGVTWDEVKTE
jgi:hypothetical protein